MPEHWKGQFIMTEDARHDIEIDRYGVAGGTEYYWGPFDQAIGFAIGKVFHPIYPWLRRSKTNITRSDANYCEVRITYGGVPPETDQHTYSTSGATSTEPIETHPKFPDFGTSDNGATFDDDGKFTGFTDKSNKKYGVKSYLSGNLNFSDTHVIGNLANGNNLQNLGYIDSAVPNSPVRPTISSDRTWILVSGTAEQVGETGGKAVKTWRLSALRGWDTDIYEK